MSLRTAGIYNLTRTTRNILKRYRKEAPSLTMHLHSTGFRFGQTDSPVHAYDGELKHWIECIRQQKMPNDLLDVLDDSDIRFFDGCLIVEVHDHRSIDRPDHQPITEEATAAQNSPHPNAAASAPTNRIKAEASTQEVSQDLPNDQVTLHRLVLSPTCDTLWKDIQFMNEAKIAQMRGIAKDIKGKEFLWDPLTEDEAVALESAILVCIARVGTHRARTLTSSHRKELHRPSAYPLVLSPHALRTRCWVILRFSPQRISRSRENAH